MRLNRLITFATTSLLSACVSMDPSHRPPDLIVEGNENSYPSFEKAAEECAYRDYRRFPGATVQGNTVGSHYNLFATNKRAARCAVDWVYKHGATGLRVSYH